MANPTNQYPIRLHRKTALRRLILLCAIMVSGGNLILPRELLLLIMLLVGIITFSFISLQIHKQNMPIYLWVCLVMVIATTFSLNGDPSAIVVRLIHFLMGLGLIRIYLCKHHNNFLADDLRVVLYPTAYLGIATFFLALIGPGLFTLLEFRTQQMVTFLGLFNYSRPLTEGTIRPISIFWEPGIFAAYLNILFFILMFQKAKPFRIMLATFAILLTQSTAGMIILGIQIIYFTVASLFTARKKNRDAVLILIVCFSAPFLFTFGFDNITEKVSGLAAGSFAARFFDFQTAVQVVQANPLVGIGFSPSAYLPYSMDDPLRDLVLAESDIDGRFNTNGVMIVFFSVGIPLGICYVLAVFFQPFFPHRALFGIVLLLSLLSSPISMTAFFVFIFFSGMASKSYCGYTTKSTSLKIG